MSIFYHRQSYHLKEHGLITYGCTFMVLVSCFTSIALNAQNESDLMLTKSRYSTGLICQVKGWEFCATWASSSRLPGSRIA